jgi:hypothetical protein
MIDIARPGVGTDDQTGHPQAIAVLVHPGGTTWS